MFKVTQNFKNYKVGDYVVDILAEDKDKVVEVDVIPLINKLKKLFIDPVYELCTETNKDIKSISKKENCNLFSNLKKTFFIRIGLIDNSIIMIWNLYDYFDKAELKILNVINYRKINFFRATFLDIMILIQRLIVTSLKIQESTSGMIN